MRQQQCGDAAPKARRPVWARVLMPWRKGAPAPAPTSPPAPQRVAAPVSDLHRANSPAPSPARHPRHRPTSATTATAVASAFLLFASAACGVSTQSGTQNKSQSQASLQNTKPIVLTTFTVLADIAQNVAGDHLEVQSLTKVGAEIHGYEPTPGDLRKTVNAQLILDNGLNLESWFERFFADIDVPRVTVSDGVEPIDIASDAYAGKPNPHAWMSPVNVELYVDNIARAFAHLDPRNASDYAANAAAYKQKLTDVQSRLVENLAGLDAEKRALVTCEGAFSYLARDAGLTEAYMWPVNAERQSTPSQIAHVIDFVESHDVNAVFCESTISSEPMQRVVETTGTAFGGTLYVDSLSGPDGPVPTYLDLINHDIDLIIAGLSGEQSGEQSGKASPTRPAIGEETQP